MNNDIPTFKDFIAEAEKAASNPLMGDAEEEPKKAEPGDVPPVIGSEPAESGAVPPVLSPSPAAAPTTAAAPAAETPGATQAISYVNAKHIWQQAGKPQDITTIRQILIDAGLSEEIIDKAFKSVGVGTIRDKLRSGWDRLKGAASGAVQGWQQGTQPAPPA